MKHMKQFCKDVYENEYNLAKKALLSDLSLKTTQGNISEKKMNELETISQKEAIKQSILQTMTEFSELELADIWRTIYEIHVHRKSGINDAETIAKVISADQSWKKSSGHAFEEMIKSLGSNLLKDDDIEIILQRDLNVLIKAKELANEPRDISWLKEQIKGSIFDLYAIVNKNGKKYCYGCIQSKTSIRDRVTRDREPSMQAMQSFFWSVIIVLDGDFLKLPKFNAMVNGGTQEFPSNGWHALYVFSNKYTGKRIFPIDLNFANFKSHAIKAAEAWLAQRQWLDNTWST